MKKLNLFPKDAALITYLLNSLNPMSNFLIIAEFEARALWSDKAGLIRMFIEPIAYLILLTAGLEGTIGQTIDSFSYISFVYPGIVTLQAFRTFVHSAYRLTVDRRWGLQAIKMVAGTSRYAYLTGSVVVPIAICAIQMAITYPFAIWLGATLSIVGLIIMTLMGMIVAFFWTSFAAILTFYFKRYSQRDFVINSLFLPMTLSAPVFYSLEKAPYYLQVISKMNPLSYQVHAMRNAFLYHTFDASAYVVFISAVLFFFIALKVLSKAEFLPSETA